MEKKLERDESNKMLAGVAAGLSDYLSIDVTWVRVMFICMVVFGFSGIWIYIILWIAVPVKVYSPVSANRDYRHTDYKVYEPTSTYGNAGSFAQSPVNPGRKDKDNSVRYVTGMILIALGSYFLLDQFIILPDWISIEKLWPLVFVAIGLVILFKPSGKKKVDNPQKETPFENNNESTSQATGEEPLI